MASGLVTTHSHSLLNYLFRGGSYSPIATYYVALFTVAPTNAGGGTEVTGGSYARQAIANNSAQWAAPANKEISNANDVVFPAATAGWGTVVAFALMDALTAGNMVGYGSLSSPIAINAGSIRVFKAGTLRIRLD